LLLFFILVCLLEFFFGSSGDLGHTFFFNI
jgi:hypothetical protein